MSPSRYHIEILNTTNLNTTNRLHDVVIKMTGYQRVSEGTLERLRKFVASEERRLCKQGNRGTYINPSWTFDEALSELLTKAGF